MSITHVEVTSSAVLISLMHWARAGTGGADSKKP